MNKHTGRTTPVPPGISAVNRTTLSRESDAIQDRGVVIATRDRHLISEWARRHGAEPATGLSTSTGPSTVNVQDGGASVRLNFPAAAAFRPITWDEWFAIFDEERLVFAYEPDESASGGTFGRQAGSYYRILREEEWPGELS